MSKSENGIGARVYSAKSIYAQSVDFPGCSNVEYLHNKKVVLLRDYEELCTEYCKLLDSIPGEKARCESC